jgi:hypothetical protein
MWIDSEQSRNEIYGGLIVGYTAKLAAFIYDERLDNRWGTSGYCEGFYCFRFPMQGEIYSIGGAVNSLVRPKSL